MVPLPSFYETGRKYTAECDIFSIGIVIADTITGNMSQFEPSDLQSAKLMTMTNGIGNLTAFLVTFTVSLAVYLQTVAPSIVGGDSGELVAEGCKLGTAHPPGYPLFIILVNIVTRLGSMYGPSDASPAFFVNVLCCVIGSFAAGLLSSCVYLLSTKKCNFFRLSQHHSGHIGRTALCLLSPYLAIQHNGRSLCSSQFLRRPTCTHGSSL